jgi:hypothetical protein
MADMGRERNDGFWDRPPSKLPFVGLDVKDIFGPLRSLQPPERASSDTYL